jgi:hypothetical protein
MRRRKVISDKDAFNQVLDAAGAVGEVLDYYNLDEFDAIYCLATCMSAMIVGGKFNKTRSDNMIHDVSEIIRTQINPDYKPHFKGAGK